MGARSWAAPEPRRLDHRCYDRLTMSLHHFTLFDTPIGRCAVAWSDRGIGTIRLPEIRESETRAAVRVRFPHGVEAPPPEAVGRTIAGIVALLEGKPVALDDAPLDLAGVPPFHQRVYAMARTIPAGATGTYGGIAAALGDRQRARAVGQALGRNPFLVVVPCHRVLTADAKLGGFSGAGGITTKLRLLRIESVHAVPPERRMPIFAGDGAFGFDADVAVRHLHASDAVLGRLIDEVGPFRLTLKRTDSIYSALAESIVYQQLTGRAAATIHARLCALFPYGHQGPRPASILRASDERLRGAGLSRAKIIALRDLAERTRQGEIPSLSEASTMEDETLIERLSAVRGIGRWTVQMLLMFRLGRPDVLPLDDYGVRKGLGAIMGSRTLPSKETLATRGEAWRPYRSVASWYLWRAAERSGG